MKRILVALLAATLLFSAACAAPGGGEAEPAPTPAPQDPIAAATAHELRGLIAQYESEGDYQKVYEAALRLTELEPTDADAYIAAAEALLRLSETNFKEIARLMEQGGQAKDVAAVVEWARQHQPEFAIPVPFAPDYVSPDEINAVGITTGNQSNAAKYGGIWRGGLLTWQGGWVYLAQAGEDFAIYKMRADGSVYQRVGEAHGTSLNVAGDWLYFINPDDGDTPWRMRTDGAELEKLGPDSCGFLSVAGDWLYYDNGSDNACLYKMKTDGSEATKLNDATTMFACGPGRLRVLRRQERDRGPVAR